MQNLETWQWIALAVAAAAFVWPRRSEIVQRLKNIIALDSRPSTLDSGAAPDANAVAAAYRLLAPFLSAETAAKVRAETADGFLRFNQEAKP